MKVQKLYFIALKLNHPVTITVTNHTDFFQWINNTEHTITRLSSAIAVGWPVTQRPTKWRLNCLQLHSIHNLERLFYFQLDILPIKKTQKQNLNSYESVNKQFFQIPMKMNFKCFLHTGSQPGSWLDKYDEFLISRPVQFLCFARTCKMCNLSYLMRETTVSCHNADKLIQANTTLIFRLIENAC